MKKTKIVLASLLLIGASSSFAQLSGSGIDNNNSGKISLSVEAVGSCTAPSLSVILGNIDFHAQANGPTGVYQQSVNIPVQCTNPNQTWGIFAYTGSFSFTSGVNGSNPEQGYVSLADPSMTPGQKIGDNADLISQMQANSDAYNQGTMTLQQVMDSNSLLGTQSIARMFLVGSGSSSVTGQLTFGKSVPAGTVTDQVFNGNGFNGAVPTGTIDGRGAFSVDIPLQIYY